MKNGELQLLNIAIQDIKLFDAPLERIEQMLRYCMLIAGIRADNLPTPVEAGIMIDFLKRQLGNYSLSEYKLAFELAAAEKLDVDANHYENFTCNYIARIMKAYRKYANTVLECAEQIQEIKKQLPPKYDVLDLLNTYYKEFLKDELNFKTVSETAYDTAFEYCDMIYTEEDLRKCIQAAKRDVLINYKETRKPGEAKALSEIPFEQVCCNYDVQRLAKLKLLELWFQRLKSKGVKIIIKK